ncbi:NYN domain-containing protein [Bradyrhizobium sp. 180]|nr:NYN domain-containing protein [Bradyrhizobium sp. 180]
MSPAPETIALFIDGANLYATTKALGFDIDYKRLLSEFQGHGTLLRAFYYTAVIEDQEFSSIRPLIDWLDYNGYTVVAKATKEFVDASGRRRVKGNMDIELAVDAMELAGRVDQIVLFSGDGDFRSLVEALQRRGVRVTVVSTIASQPPMIADELRRQADVFTDLAELQSRVGRTPSDRPAPRERGAARPRGRHRRVGCEASSASRATPEMYVELHHSARFLNRPLSKHAICLKPPRFV